MACAHLLGIATPTLLHTLLARKVGAGAVLHTHSIWGTLLSEALQPAGRLQIAGYEMLKGLSGVSRVFCLAAAEYEGEDGVHVCLLARVGQVRTTL